MHNRHDGEDVRPLGHKLIFSSFYKGDWGTRLQENPQSILQLVVMIQLTSRRILRD